MQEHVADRSQHTQGQIRPTAAPTHGKVSEAPSVCAELLTRESVCCEKTGPTCLFLLLHCVTRRKQHQPGITPNDNTTHVPTAGSSAALTKPNQTPTQHPRAKGKQSYKRSHPTPHEADAHTSHVHKNAPSLLHVSVMSSQQT